MLLSLDFSLFKLLNKVLKYFFPTTFNTKKYFSRVIRTLKGVKKRLVLMIYKRVVIMFWNYICKNLTVKVFEFVWEEKGRTVKLLIKVKLRKHLNYTLFTFTMKLWNSLPQSAVKSKGIMETREEFDKFARD